MTPMLLKRLSFHHYIFILPFSSDIEDDVGSLKQFTTELVYEASVRCLQLITSGFELSHRLPPAMAQRFRAGSTLAQACMVNAH